MIIIQNSLVNSTPTPEPQEKLTAVKFSLNMDNPGDIANLYNDGLPLGEVTFTDGGQPTVFSLNTDTEAAIRELIFDMLYPSLFIEQIIDPTEGIIYKLKDLYISAPYGSITINIYPQYTNIISCELYTGDITIQGVNFGG